MIERIHVSLSSNKFLSGTMIFVIFLLGYSFSIAQEPLDLRAALLSVYDNAKEQGNLHDLPKGLINGDLYSRGYKLAQRNMSKSQMEGIDMTYNHLKETCNGDISLAQVTKVFQHTKAGRELYALLEHRNMLASLNDGEFSEACIQVYLCANKKTDMANKDRTRLYTLNTFEQCQNIIQSIHQSIVVRSSGLTSLEDSNYGDDIFANRKQDDAPYDLLYDIEKIGNMLYVHNDPATETQFYDIRPVGTYQQPDPLTAQDYVEAIPKPTPQNPLAHLPASNGVTPAIPDVSYVETLNTRNQSFVPSDSKSVQGRSNQGFPQPIVLGGNMQSRASPLVIQGGGGLGNNICESPIDIPEEIPQDLLKDAEDQQEETYEYTADLDLKDRVALDIFKGLMPPEIEELPVSERGGKGGGTSAGGTTPGGGAGGGTASQGGNGVGGGTVAGGTATTPGTAGGSNDLGSSVINELNIDSDGGTLSSMKEGLQKCLEDSGLDKNLWRKEIWKKAGEAIALSQCVQNVLCKGVHDPSDQGMFTIKFCKIPSKRYNVVANMPIHSIEEVINELRNICINLKDSGELIKHQQTKDGIFSSQLPKLNLKKMFTFEIAFTTKPTRSEKDVRTEKTEQEQQNQYLQKTILGMTDQLTHENQRNKYIIIANPFEAKAQTELGGLLDVEQERVRKAQAFYEGLQATDRMQQDVLAQKKLMAETQDAYEQYIQQQIKFREVMHGHMNDLNKKWEAKYNEFQHSKK